MKNNESHTDVLLLTYGEPYRNSFFEHWRYSIRILNKLTRRVAPIPRAAVPLIGAYRAAKRTREWKEAGYLSPLESITERQRTQLQQKLIERNPQPNWRVHTVYEFRGVDLVEVLRDRKEDSSVRVLVLPMYVAQSDFTSGLSREDCDVYRNTLDDSLKIEYIEPGDHCDRLGALMASFVIRQLKQRGFDLDRPAKRGLLLGAHGTVISPHPAIRENGYEATYRLGAQLIEQIGGFFESASIGWFNHRRGGEWSAPAMEEAAATMLQNGIQDIVFFPFGFLADNEETELGAKSVLESAGIRDYTHLPCLNNDEEFIDFLSDIILSTVDCATDTS